MALPGPLKLHLDHILDESCYLEQRNDRKSPMVLNKNSALTKLLGDDHAMCDHPGIYIVCRCYKRILISPRGKIPWNKS